VSRDADFSSPELESAERRLQESEEMHRLALELTQQITWTVEADGTGLKLSHRYRELTGMTDETAELSIHPEDRGLVSDRWTRSLVTGSPFEVECRLRMRDGRYRAFHVRARPRRDARGRILRWYGVSEDVQDQKQAELGRRDAEERYRLVQQATNDAIWDHDFLDGTIDWSENAAAILRVSALVGRQPQSLWEERIHPDEKLALLESLSKAIAGEASRWSGTYRFRRDDGSYADVLDRGFIMRDDNGKAIRAVGAMSDVTERHRAEAEIRRIQAELIHVSRLSAMGAMATTLAHELNQPLTAVTNFIRGARRIAEDPETSKERIGEALEEAEIAARRAGDILRRVRELVARGQVTVQVENLPQLIDEAALIAFIGTEALGIRHRLELDPAAWWVRADRIQIQQVLINLVRNAIEAMANSDNREILISTRAKGSMVEIEVADTGCGIACDDPDQLFSEFMTTKSEGMGLGLAISRTIVEAHGGQIEARKRDGGGAAFAFTLPRVRRRAAKAL
jgi:two-component system, LuxR family, sensor kinase FixL